MALDLSFEDIRDQIIQGLYSGELSLYLLGRIHVDKYQLFNDIVEYERLMEARSQRKTSSVHGDTWGYYRKGCKTEPAETNVKQIEGQTSKTRTLSITTNSTPLAINTDKAAGAAP